MEVIGDDLCIVEMHRFSSVVVLNSPSLWRAKLIANGLLHLISQLEKVIYENYNIVGNLLREVCIQQPFHSAVAPMPHIVRYSNLSLNIL